MAEKRIVKDGVCSFCGTLCDDLDVVVEDGKIVEVRHACRIGAAKFLTAQEEDRHTRPMIRENGDWKEYMPTAIAGIEWEGTAYRMDAVPIRMRKVVEPPEGMLNDVEFLEMVIEKVEEIL